MANYSNLLAAALLGIPTAGLSNINIEIYCFTSGNEKPIQFEMREYTDNATSLSYAFIKYRNSKTWIPLAATKKSSLIAKHGISAENSTTWLEISKNSISGSYELSSQGATVNSMRYTNFSTQNTYDFIRDTSIEFSLEKGCVWQR